ncbi:MAG: cyclic nucleotide-binding domain-containing protein, partial [Desulforhopalus sp.]
SMESISFKAGTSLFRYGEQGDCMYFVVSGRVAVQNSTGFGERMQVVALLDAGAPVGEQGILGHVKRGSTVVAVKDSELLVLTRSAFEALVGENSLLAASFLQYLLGRVALRLQKCSERLAHVL